MTRIIWFNEPDSDVIEIVGGKGANLARLTRAGFEVPPGFTITTGAYSAFLSETGLDNRIAAILSDLKFDDTSTLERGTQQIREMICSASVPTDLAAEITVAYERLGADTYVAVRSSGAAEDLEGASFAGLHDTYLDIHGIEDLLDAVRRCWASLWTARATSYRQTKGFDHLQSPIALVIQTMVESEVSGVVFTGNPMTAATDEIVINASWGLGEAVVGGIVNPDEFVVKSGTLRIIERKLGEKEVRVVRNPKTGVGIITEPTEASIRAQYSLSDDQITNLAGIARQIQSSYEDFPQDIEWCMARGKIYIVQSRPITGVEFSWDADVTDSIPGKDRDEDQPIWSRAWSGEIWTGAVTPLMFSWRGICNTLSLTHSISTKLGYDEVSYSEMRYFKFYKATPYYNAHLDKAIAELTLPPASRKAMLSQVPADWHDDILQAPFNLLRYLRGHLRSQLAFPENGLGWHKTLENAITTESERFDGLSTDGLRLLSDAELKKYLDEMIETEGKYYNIVAFGLVYIFRDTMNTLSWIVTNWYDGDNPGAFTDIITGSRRATTTFKENLSLWRLSQQIRNSSELLAIFRKHEGKEFFAQLRDNTEGRAFLVDYDKFVKEHGHRGHADRDIYFTRRAEDSSVDYRAFQTMLSADFETDPEVREREINARRETVIEEVVENIRRKPFGALKAEAFKLVLDYVFKCLAGRDDERALFDRSTFAIKKGCLEISRRLIERELVDSDRDFYFLAKPELYDLLDGHANMRLTKAKIAARMHDFDRVYSKELVPPSYLSHGRPAELDVATIHGDGIYQGAGTSRGKVTGTACVIKNLEDIGRVQHGDILVTNSTDPGWTPVFLVIKGIVLETGGLLAHGALLAREYGFPGVQLTGSMQLIPDGATICIDGDSGTVVIIDEPDH